MTTIWATTLGTGKARGQLERRRAARAEKAEANAKFWAIGSTRRVGRFKELRRYGGHIIAVYVMDGIPAQPVPSGLGDRMLEWMQSQAEATNKWAEENRIREMEKQAVLRQNNETTNTVDHGIPSCAAFYERWREAFEGPRHG